MKNWIQNSIIPLVISIVTWVITVMITLAVAKQELGNHIMSKDVHMPFEKKLEKFVGRPEYNLHTVQANKEFEKANKRFDKLDASALANNSILNKIYDKLNERRKRK